MSRARGQPRGRIILAGTNSRACPGVFSGGCIPPSTDTVCEVMNRLMTSEHTACATSSGLPSLPTGTLAASLMYASSSSCSPPGGVPPSIRAGATARITPLGEAVTMTGVILLRQNIAKRFESWAYAWALVFPTSIGLGQMIHGWLKGKEDMVMTGVRSALIGAVLFLVGAFFFELVIGIRGVRVWS